MTHSPVQPVVRPPSAAEAAAIEHSRVRHTQRPRRPAIKAQPTGAAARFEAEHSDTHGLMGMVLDAFATTSDDFGQLGINQLLNAMADPTRSAVQGLNAALAVVAGIEARNEAEAQLGIQMAATHEAAMKMLRVATSSADQKTTEVYGNLATKLLRTYTSQIEALAKLKRGGEQTVRVEHVHVHSGGQAIVGNVSAKNGRGE